MSLTFLLLKLEAPNFGLLGLLVAGFQQLKQCISCRVHFIHFSELGNLLLSASKTGFLEKVNYYVSNGTDVNFKDKEGNFLNFIFKICICPIICSLTAQNILHIKSCVNCFSVSHALGWGVSICLF